MDKILEVKNLKISFRTCLMWYIWQKDKLHRQETEALRKSIDRLTSSVEKVLTFLYEEGK